MTSKSVIISGNRCEKVASPLHIPYSWKTLEPYLQRTKSKWKNTGVRKKTIYKNDSTSIATTNSSTSNPCSLSHYPYRLLHIFLPLVRYRISLLSSSFFVVSLVNKTSLVNILSNHISKFHPYLVTNLVHRYDRAHCLLALC